MPNYTGKTLKKFLPVFFIGLIVFSAGLILYFILKYGIDVPYMDQWEYVGFFDHLSKGTLTFDELYRQQCEYRQIFPNLVFVGLGALTRWDVRYEMLFSFVLALLVMYNVYRLSNILKYDAPWQKWLLLCLASLFIFAPIQYENWLFGVQIEYFMPIACITTCMAVIYSGLRNVLKLIFCVLLAVISTYSSVNGLLCWIVVLPLFLFSEKAAGFFQNWIPLTVWLFGTCVTITFYFTGYESPANFPSPFEFLKHPVDALLYLMGLLGNPFRMVHALKPIIVVGVGMLTLFVALCVYVGRYFRDRVLLFQAMPWLMLGLYSIMTGGMVMTGRLGFGLFQSLTSRYTTYTLYLPVALLFLIYVISTHLAKRTGIKEWPLLLLILMAAFVVYVKADTFNVAVNDLKNYHHNIRHAKAALHFVNYVPHETCESKIYLVHFDELRQKANTLNKLGYLRPPLAESNLLQNITEADGRAGEGGAFNALTKQNDTLYLACGQTNPNSTGNVPDAILLTYDDTLSRPVVFTLYNADSLQWKKSFSVNSVPYRPTYIRAWAFETETGKALRLKGAFLLE
ncbi:MAG: hypothetical protein BWY70_00036 [Bacteroidetes bacterium ADurb.Bin408]|nr:MAG: hypothetical protein BWY70_00036 [Bacteroidetes bacterium ADurb.Bin408]